LVGVVGHHEGRRYTIVGDMVNTAARIEHAAPVGAVAIGIGTLTAIPAATTRGLLPTARETCVALCGASPLVPKRRWITLRSSSGRASTARATSADRR